jgi:single-stranded DNA-binding protein
MKIFSLAGHLGMTPRLLKRGATLRTNLLIAAEGRHGVEDWFSVATFGPLAEELSKNLEIGDGVSVWGELHSHRYNGLEHVELIADGADFFSKKK